MSRSLRRELSFWIASATLVIGIIAAACSFLLAFKEARELQDDQLRQTALLVERAGGKVSFWTELDKKVPDNDPESRIIITPIDRPDNNSGAIRNHHLPQIPANLTEGFKTVEMLGENWRLYIHTLPSGQRIATGQQTAVRDETARDSSMRTLLPILFLILALVLLTTAIIRKALDPVIQLSGQLDQRDDTNLQPLVDNGKLPDEIAPFVSSINNLMIRISEVLAQQRHFIADAAHELRSPLTALTIQAANLDRALTPQERSQRLEQLRQGLNRASLLLDQLLSLARQQSGTVISEEIRFDRVIRQVIEDLMPLAAVKDVDLGAEQVEDIVVTAPADALSVLVRNAIDNAVRYTPAGGKVDVSLFHEDGQVVFQVADNGPGIPAGEEKRIFEPFYRVIGSNETGSGLGLAIVYKIAERLGGTVSLCNRIDCSGALFRYMSGASKL